LKLYICNPLCSKRNTTSLARLLRTRVKLNDSSESKKDNLALAIHNIIRDIGIPLGVVPNSLV
jgi:hypothetical protein